MVGILQMKKVMSTPFFEFLQKSPQLVGAFYFPKGGGTGIRRRVGCRCARVARDARPALERAQALGMATTLENFLHPDRIERGLSVPEFEALLDDANKKDVPMLFTLGSAWAGYIQQNTSDWNAVAELGRVEAIMDRVVELDEGYQYGQAHMYLGVLNSILPASLGGNPYKAQTHFEKAVTLSEGKNLLAPVLYAEKYARLVFDRELHDRLLNEVLAADPEVHGLTLQNTYAQQQATALLADADDYF